MSTEIYYKRNKKTQSKHTYGYKEKDANFLTELVTHTGEVFPLTPTPQHHTVSFKREVILVH